MKALIHEIHEISTSLDIESQTTPEKETQIKVALFNKP